MHNKSSKNGSARFWPTPQANKTTESGEIVNADGTPWDGISKPHGAATGRPITTALADAIRFSIPTSSPSTEPTTPGLTCSQVDFLANLSVSPGSEKARQMTVRSGRKCCELLGKPSPLGSLVRMLLESSRWNSTISFLTWKASATPRGRLLFRLVPSMPDTDATEFGLWPTPTSDEANNVTRKSGDFQSLTRKVQESVKMWPTPTANEDACVKSTGKMQAMLGNHPDLGKDKTQGSLNPQFVEWLMGYPKDWTAVEDFASGRKKTMKPQELPAE